VLPVCYTLACTIYFFIIISALIELGAGPPEISVTPVGFEDDFPPRGPPAPPSSFALDSAPPTAAREGSLGSAGTETGPPEVDPEVEDPPALPRRVTLSWRRLIPRYTYSKAAFSYLIIMAVIV